MMLSSNLKKKLPKLLYGYPFWTYCLPFFFVKESLFLIFVIVGKPIHLDLEMIRPNYATVKL